MRRIFYVVLAVIAMFLVSGGYGVEAKDSIELGLHLSEGMTYTQTEMTEILTDQEILGERVYSVITTRNVYANEVLRVDRFGAADVLITYKSVYYKQEGPNGVEEFDSERPKGASSDLAKGYAALIGGQFIVRYSPQGQVLAVEGIQVLIDRIIDQYEFEDETALQSFRESIEAICNETTIKETMALPTGIYPKEAVRVGFGWRQTERMNTGLPIRVESEWRLENLSNGLAYIRMQAKMLPDDDAEPLMIETMQISYELYGTMVGGMEVMENTGLISQADFKLELSGDIKLANVPGFTETITAHVVVNGRTHIEIVDLALPTQG
jgi:hypothetical protein